MRDKAKSSDMEFSSEIIDFWKKIESELNCSVPLYLKNILNLCGYDTIVSIETIKEDDISYMEKFGREEMGGMLFYFDKSLINYFNF